MPRGINSEHTNRAIGYYKGRGTKAYQANPIPVEYAQGIKDVNNRIFTPDEDEKFIPVYHYSTESHPKVRRYNQTDWYLISNKGHVITFAETGRPKACVWTQKEHTDGKTYYSTCGWNCVHLLTWFSWAYYCIDNNIPFKNYNVEGYDRPITKDDLKVLAEMIGRSNESTQVHHKDGNTANNNIENLELCTKATNMWLEKLLKMHKKNKDIEEIMLEIAKHVNSKTPVYIGVDGDRVTMHRLYNYDFEKLERWLKENVTKEQIKEGLVLKIINADGSVFCIMPLINNNLVTFHEIQDADMDTPAYYTLDMREE